MRFASWAVLILFLTSLQMTWFSVFHSEEAPDFLLMFILLHALDEGRGRGAVVGFLLGFLQDITTFSLFGFYSLTRALVGYVVGASRESVYRDRPLFFVVLVAIVTLVIKAMYLLVLHFLSGSAVDVAMVIANSLKCMLWNVACAVPLWLLYNFIREWLWRRSGRYY
jgi:rod shape-determining protein MreD